MDNVVKHIKHKEWRKIAKKERRRNLRRKIASEREDKIKQLQLEQENDIDYLNSLKEEEEKKKAQQIEEEREHAERERQWLEDEDKAQEEWRQLQQRKEKARQVQREQEETVRKEYEDRQEALQRKKLEEKRRFEEEMRKQKEFEQQLDDYIDDGAKTPENMRTFKETNPGKELCPFFDKTNACRYGDNCSRNHRKIGLSKVVLIPHFYSHFSLEKNTAEYDTDINLEYDATETRRHFREFYKDIVPELENFGRIKTLRVCCNSQFHLRGNVYVEYYSERYAAHAVRNLRGRWYGGRQLHCEFANIQSWRHAICGLKRNCPKGKRTCNFLHTLRNPDDEYAVKSPPKYVKSMYGYTAKTENCNRSERRTRSKWGDTEKFSDDDDKKCDNDQNWRWSESPDREQDNYQRNDNRNYQYRNYRNYNYRNNRYYGYYDDGSRTPSSLSSRSSSTPERTRRSSSRHRSRRRNKRSRNRDYYSDEDDDDYRRRKKRRSSSSRHRSRHPRRYHSHRRRSHRDHRSRRRHSSYSDKCDSDYDKRSRDSKDNDDHDDSQKKSSRKNSLRDDKQLQTPETKSVENKTLNQVSQELDNLIPDEIPSKVANKSNNEFCNANANVTHLQKSSEEESSSGSSSSSDSSSEESEDSSPEKMHNKSQLEVKPVKPQMTVAVREYEWDTTESEGEISKK